MPWKCGALAATPARRSLKEEIRPPYAGAVRIVCWLSVVVGLFGRVAWLVERDTEPTVPANSRRIPVQPCSLFPNAVPRGTHELQGGAAAMPVVAVDNLRYRYPGQSSLALDGISFTAEAGEFIGIAGRQLVGEIYPLPRLGRA